MVTEHPGRESADTDLTRALAREIYASVANKWALLLINVLADRTLRFTELQTQVGGISHKMLSQTLRHLERDGLVDRTVHPVVPPRVEYRLTEAGQALRTTVNGLCTWTHTYLDHIEEARRRFDSARAV
ncbi:winged helix-turn-helix transcriptional regulator [Streptomyces griseus]|uniref:winged helix-turn-helix transcriptional regulator n=1 Tax=Streptomyces griseus TaxID=1911 RepID=UPI0008407CAC|nr:helix-turn-helix domain-containing protein [Streptomyces griseus]